MFIGLRIAFANAPAHFIAAFAVFAITIAFAASPFLP